MSDDHPKPTVREVPGELLRFYVASASRPDVEHMVDLAMNQGHGYCSCEAFEFNYQKRIASRAAELFSPEVTCRHLAAVHEHFIRTRVAREVREFANQPAFRR